MTLLALLIGLIIERIATQLFHLRRLRWLDRLIDGGFRLGDRFAAWPAPICVLVMVLVLIAPVFGALLYLWDESYGIEDLLFAVVILFFSLGPQDIGEDVAEYCRAVETDDEEGIQHTAKALIEQDAPEDPLERIRAVEESVCVQANNRLFAVVFWFVACGSFGPFGPLAAWTYRVTDLIRRRAVFNASRDTNASEALLAAAVMLHGWLIWIPARLTAIGYAMAGSFEAAFFAWRHPQAIEDGSVHSKSEQLLARVGIGALALDDIDGENLSERGVRGAMAANGLVYRLFFIWVFVIGWMTLYGLSQ